MDNCTPRRPATLFENDARRRRELGHFLPLWPDELADLTVAGRDRIIRLLRKALREERRRGIQGHWAYDLARHAALLRIYQAEVRSRGALSSPRAAGTKPENDDRSASPDLLKLPRPSHIPRDSAPRPS